MTDPNGPLLVARWMVEQLDRDRYLEQEVVLHEIEAMFGDAYVYTNDSGNLAIAKSVLAAFRELTGTDVVWERSERLWRRRETHDGPGRAQE